ncbi:hypothetical protein [Thalassovita sp.]|uniref:hypothetical protein n=1 Tax=Thalassovita sp. TaxID=1979401 RepID=UPI0029DE770A|nr:hypothetical protein [Thalassovita sp.]
MQNPAPSANSLPHACQRGGQAITRETMKFFGVVLGLASCGLWLVPGAAGDGAEMLVRLVLSFLFLGIAAGLWGAGRVRLDDEFHLDVTNHRLDHMLRGQDGIARLKRRYGFDDLEEISLKGGVLMARLAGGQEVLRVAVGSHLEPGVRDGLRRMGKLPAL